MESIADKMQESFVSAKFWQDVASTDNQQKRLSLFFL